MSNPPYIILLFFTKKLHTNIGLIYIPMLVCNFRESSPITIIRFLTNKFSTFSHKFLQQIPTHFLNRYLYNPVRICQLNLKCKDTKDKCIKLNK